MVDFLDNKKYFWLSHSTGYDDTTPVAYASGNKKLAHELVPEVVGLAKLPFTFKLETVRISKKGLERLGYLVHQSKPVDYQPNNLAWPLVSLKMMKIIQSHLKGSEGIKWISVDVLCGDIVCEYFVPCFMTKLDTLDNEKTLFVPNTSHIIKPVFSLVKTSKYEVFHGHSIAWQISTEIYVSEAIVKELKESNISGVKFEPVRLH
ncbi:MAG: hypothetical protein RBT74_06060 [Tenuifilaceae bacterium]|jgi:hypothetical protein|nr:hypothetical protein [Tenuifilaceae bacterium]